MKAFQSGYGNARVALGRPYVSVISCQKRFVDLSVGVDPYVYIVICKIHVPLKVGIGRSMLMMIVAHQCHTQDPQLKARIALKASHVSSVGVVQIIVAM